MATEETARAVKSKYSLDLLKKPGVSGVGVEKDQDGEYVIALHLDQDHPQLANDLPQKLEGVRVKHVFSGPFRPL